LFLLSLTHLLIIYTLQNKYGKLLKDNKNTTKQKHKKSMQKSHPKFQLKRNEIAQHVSFVVVMSIIFFGPFFDMWVEPSLMKLQHGQAWASSLRFLGFMVFVLAVATMILVGVPFVGMQSFVLIFWAIWMNLKS
jgi:cation transport ATPase